MVHTYIYPQVATPTVNSHHFLLLSSHDSIPQAWFGACWQSRLTPGLFSVMSQRTTDWSCCRCHMAWSYTLHEACANCQHWRCHSCNLRATQPRPRPKPRHAPTRTTNGHTVLAQTTPTVGAKARIYTCCQCGDGPNVWDHQRKCISCGHLVCSHCKWAK